jgi:hypothetical protein
LLGCAGADGLPAALDVLVGAAELDAGADEDPVEVEEELLSPPHAVTAVPTSAAATARPTIDVRVRLIPLLPQR